MKEHQFIDWIRSQSRFDPVKVPVGPGDDCAVVSFSDDKLIVTTDQVLDGVHFILAEHGPTAAGRKAMARNLSSRISFFSEPMGMGCLTWLREVAVSPFATRGGASRGG